MSMIYDKYALANSSLQSDVTSLLDVGCRDGILKSYLRPGIIYTGLDIMPGPNVDRIANIEEGLPFADREFDAVAALDLLEHTNNIWFAFDELVRVSRRQVIIVLPNLYHWQSRIRFLLGREMGKYVLPVDPVMDRHRWLTSYNFACRFCTERAKKHGMSVTEHVLFGGRRTAPVDWVLAKMSNNLAAWAVMHVLERPV
jgi:SAM-dependent methyltransferase